MQDAHAAGTPCIAPGPGDLRRRTDQQCSERYVAEHWYPPFGWGQIDYAISLYLWFADAE
jgi:hypothetical protein